MSLNFSEFLIFGNIHSSCSYLSFPLLIATAPGDDIALPNTSFTNHIKNTITSTGIRHVVTMSTASPSMNLLTMFFTLSAVTDNVFFTLFTASFALSIKLLSESLLFLLSFHHPLLLLIHPLNHLLHRLSHQLTPGMYCKSFLRHAHLPE